MALYLVAIRQCHAANSGVIRALVGMYGAVLTDVRNRLTGGVEMAYMDSKWVAEQVEDSKPVKVVHNIVSDGAEHVCTRCGFMPMDLRTGDWDTCK